MVTRKRLFYDIETSFCQGHFWRPGYNQRIGAEQIMEYGKIISIHWNWEGSDTVHNLHWGLNKQCDKKLVKAFIKLLDQSDEIVAHNGDRFDIKWIRSRAVYHDLEMKHTYNMIDTFKWCKKYLNLPSNSLKEACKYFDLPLKKDAGGLDTWKDVIFKKDRKALDHLLFYGDGDIVSLKALFNKLRPYALPNMHYGAKTGSAEKFHCPECSTLGKWNKTYSTRAGTVQHYFLCRDKSCNTYFKINNKSYQDYMKYKMINGIK